MTRPSQGASSLHVKLAEVRAALNGEIKKTGTNPHFKYGFVEATKVGTQFVTELSERNLTMLPIEVTEGEVSETISGKEWTHTVAMKWRITDADTGEFIDVVSMGQGSDPGDKGIPKALTNAMKYGILLVLQAAGDDPEADASVDESTGAAPRSGRSERPTRPRRGRGTAVTAPPADDDGEVSRSKSMASTAFKAKIRSEAREAGLDDDALKAFAQGITDKESSRDWTERDAEKVLNRLGKKDIVDQFLDERDLDQAKAHLGNENEGAK